MQLQTRELKMADKGAEFSGQNNDAPRSPRERFQHLELTDEEIGVLKECRTNSFYYRGVPAGILSLIATRYLTHNYYPGIKRWSGFYYTGALAVGMIAGVSSYRDKCMEKIMSLDNSRLADEVRRYQSRAHGHANGKLGNSQASSSAEDFGSKFESDHDFTSQQQQQSQTRQPLPQSPLANDDRSFGGRYHSTESQDDDENEWQPTSYEELRKRHRESRMQGPKRLRKAPQQEVDNTVDSDTYDPDTTYDRRETYSPGSSWDRSEPQTSYDDKGRHKLQQWPQTKQDQPRRNKYGDEME